MINKTLVYSYWSLYFLIIPSFLFGGDNVDWEIKSYNYIYNRDTFDQNTKAFYKLPVIVQSFIMQIVNPDVPKDDNIKSIEILFNDNDLRNVNYIFTNYILSIPYVGFRKDENEIFIIVSSKSVRRGYAVRDAEVTKILFFEKEKDAWIFSQILDEHELLDEYEDDLIRDPRPLSDEEVKSEHLEAQKQWFVMSARPFDVSEDSWNSEEAWSEHLSKIDKNSNEIEKNVFKNDNIVSPPVVIDIRLEVTDVNFDSIYSAIKSSIFLSILNQNNDMLPELFKWNKNNTADLKYVPDYLPSYFTLTAVTLAKLNYIQIVVRESVKHGGIDYEIVFVRMLSDLDNNKWMGYGVFFFKQVDGKWIPSKELGGNTSFYQNIAELKCQNHNFITTSKKMDRLDFLKQKNIPDSMKNIVPVSDSVKFE